MNIFKKFKNTESYSKAHIICIIIILFSLVLINVGKYAKIQNKKENVENYEVIDAENFDIDTNADNVFICGNLSSEEPIIYNGKEYIMVRNIFVQYDWDEKPNSFETNNGILYENDILDNRNYNVSYDTEYGNNIFFGNMKISEDNLSLFKPYIIEKTWDDNNDKQEFVSVLNSEQNFVIYVQSVEHGSINGIQVYQNINEAREDLTPSFIFFMVMSFLVALLIYLLCIMIIGLCSI